MRELLIDPSVGVSCVANLKVQYSSSSLKVRYCPILLRYLLKGALMIGLNNSLRPTLTLTALSACPFLERVQGLYQVATARAACLVPPPRPHC